MDEATFDLLRSHRVANVWISSLRMPQDYTITGDFVYLRFHGLKGGAYHDYTVDELQPWADQLEAAADRGLPCFAYFNNDLNTRAPLNAESLMKLVGSDVVPAFDATLAKKLSIKPPKVGPDTWRPWIRTGKPRRAPPKSGRSRTSSRAKPRRRATASAG
jgi:hypothetical protein